MPEPTPKQHLRMRLYGREKRRKRKINSLKEKEKKKTNNTNARRQEMVQKMDQLNETLQEREMMSPERNIHRIGKKNQGGKL